MPGLSITNYKTTSACLAALLRGLVDVAVVESHSGEIRSLFLPCITAHLFFQPPCTLLRVFETIILHAYNQFIMHTRYFTTLSFFLASEHAL